MSIKQVWMGESYEVFGVSEVCVPGDERHLGTSLFGTLAFGLQVPDARHISWVGDREDDKPTG